MAKQVAGLKLERFADASEGGESDRFGAAVLEDGQVDIGYAGSDGELCGGYASFVEKAVEVHLDGVVFVIAGGHQTTLWRSSHMAVPARVMRAKVRSPNAVSSVRYGGSHMPSQDLAEKSLLSASVAMSAAFALD